MLPLPSRMADADARVASVMLALLSVVVAMRLLSVAAAMPVMPAALVPVAVPVPVPATVLSDAVALRVPTMSDARLLLLVSLAVLTGSPAALPMLEATGVYPLPVAVGAFGCAQPAIRIVETAAAVNDRVIDRMVMENSWWVDPQGGHEGMKRLHCTLCRPRVAQRRPGSATAVGQSRRSCPPTPAQEARDDSAERQRGTTARDDSAGRPLTAGRAC